MSSSAVVRDPLIPPDRTRAGLARALAPGLLLAGSGAVALVYETLWMRASSTLFGATAPAAAATVSAMFAGLALGSAWFGRRAPRWGHPLRIYALLELGAAVAALAALALQRAFAALAPALHALLAEIPGLLLAAKALQVFLVVLPATFLLGGTLPVVTQCSPGRWRDLGLELFQASCLDDAGREEEARTRAFAVLDELPAAIRESLLGSPAGR